MAGFKLNGTCGSNTNLPRIDSGTLGLIDSGPQTYLGYTVNQIDVKNKPIVFLAYNAEGHQCLTKKAIMAALKGLPKNLRWIVHFLSDTPTSSVYRDMTDVWTLAHWRATKQKHHFMRAINQTQKDAYKENVDWILQNGTQASKNLRRIWMEKISHYNPLFVNEYMGNALHAMQDSFAGGHATRKRSADIYVITEIHVYDKKNKETHSQYDKEWKDELGKEAIVACRELTKIVVFAALQKTENQFNQKWKSLWGSFKEIFLTTTL